MSYLGLMMLMANANPKDQNMTRGSQYIILCTIRIVHTINTPICHSRQVQEERGTCYSRQVQEERSTCHSRQVQEERSTCYIRQVQEERSTCYIRQVQERSTSGLNVRTSDIRRKMNTSTMPSKVRSASESHDQPHSRFMRPISIASYLPPMPSMEGWLVLPHRRATAV